MKNALTEVIQEVALCGLSRAGFFKDAAFYGGTALRVFYGLDRFSEDLDFSLVSPDADFELKKYFSVLESELHSVGLNFKADQPHTDFVCLPDSSRCCAKFNLCKRYRNHTLVRFGPILNSHNNALMDRLIRQWRIFMDMHIVILDYYYRLFSAFRNSISTFVPVSPLQVLRPQFGHIA